MKYCHPKPKKCGFFLEIYNIKSTADINFLIKKNLLLKTKIRFSAKL